MNKRTPKDYDRWDGVIGVKVVEPKKAETKSKPSKGGKK